MEEVVKLIGYGVGLYLLYKAYFLFIKIVFNVCKFGFFEIFSNNCCNFYDEQEDENSDDSPNIKPNSNVFPRRIIYCDDGSNEGDE